MNPSRNAFVLAIVLSTGIALAADATYVPANDTYVQTKAAQLPTRQTAKRTAAMVVHWQEFAEKHDVNVDYSYVQVCDTTGGCILNDPPRFTK